MGQIEEAAKANRVAVWNFFRDNPCHSLKECAAETGLHRHTVSFHARAIRAGWRPNLCPECNREVGGDNGWRAACGRRVVDVSRHGCMSVLDGYKVINRG